MPALSNAIKRRWRREIRRRAVGRAYDMALEVVRLIPRGASVLDVGCGNGFIAHHLTSLLGSTVVGLDVADTTEALIPYLSYDGRHFPVEDQRFDAALLCYVLHHAQSFDLVMAEIRRVLNPGGLVIVYEDIPGGWWSRLVCWTHDRRWRSRSGPCTFQLADGWREIFIASGFKITFERGLSRWRNIGHPVSRRLYVLKMTASGNLIPSRLRDEQVEVQSGTEVFST